MDIGVITLRSIQEFVVLANIRNYTDAANELFISQATLSRHIVNLENDLGQALFHRTTRTVELTDFGRNFLPFAERFIKTMDECKASLYGTEKAQNEDCIRLGVFNPFLFDDRIKLPLLQFCQDNPDCTIDIKQDSDKALIDRLLRKELDAAILREISDVSDSFQRIRLSAKEPLRLVLPKSHIFANLESITVDFLKNEHFIIPPTTTNTHRAFFDRCHQIGFNPQVRSVISRESSFDMVREGRGIMILAHVAENIASDPTLAVVKIIPEIYSSTNIVYPRITKFSASFLRFLEFFKTQYKDYN